MTYRGEIERNRARNGGWKRESLPFVTEGICGESYLLLVLKMVVFMSLYKLLDKSSQVAHNLISK